MADRIKMTRGLKADLPVLDVGEFGFATDTLELFIGSPSGNVLLIQGLLANGSGVGTEPDNLVMSTWVGGIE